MGYYATISHITNRKENMFYITYYAKKHGKFITRKGQYDKPDGTKGKSFVSKNGVPCLVYWDLDNDGWRMAVGEAKVRT
tara:strand:+ start:556 stop:792 length:237 start_codon:yes stop_codon:yes gene_type:complete